MEIAAVAFMVDARTINGILLKELANIENTMGSSWRERIMLNTNAAVKFLGADQSGHLGSPQIGAEMTKHVNPGDVAGYAAKRAMSNIGIAFFKVSYQVIIRAQMFGLWLAVFIPLVIAAVIDGLTQRRINHLSFKSIKPDKLNLSRRMVGACIAFLFLVFIAPIPLSPVIYPAWILIFIFPLSAMVKNSGVGYLD